MLMILSAESRAEADDFARRVNEGTARHKVKAEREGVAIVKLWGEKDAIESILRKAPN